MNCDHTDKEREEAFLNTRCTACVKHDAFLLDAIRVHILRERASGSTSIEINDLMSYLFIQRWT